MNKEKQKRVCKSIPLQTLKFYKILCIVYRIFRNISRGFVNFFRFLRYFA